MALLKEENEKLRGAIKSHLGEEVGGGGGGGGGNGDVSLIANDPAVGEKSNLSEVHISRSNSKNINSTYFNPQPIKSSMIQTSPS